MLHRDKITKHKQKSPDLSIETRLLFISTIMKLWCQLLSLHSRSFTNSFVCNFLSSSAGINLCSCFSRLTLAFWLSLSGFSGLSIPRPCAASFPDSLAQLPAIPFSLRLFHVTGTTQLLASCFQLGHSPWLSL